MYMYMFIREIVNVLMCGWDVIRSTVEQKRGRLIGAVYGQSLITHHNEVKIRCYEVVI